MQMMMDLAYNLPNHTQKVTDVIWSPDGSQLASGSPGGSIHLWNSTNGELIRTLVGGHHKAIITLAWSPDGSQLASSSYDTAALWNISTGTCQVLTSHHKAVTTLAWSSDGTKLASGSLDHITYIWNTSTGEQLFALALEQDISSLAWSPDGEKLLILSKGKVATVWKVVPMPDLSSVPIIFESSSTFKIEKSNP